MKKGIFSIAAILAVFAMVALGCSGADDPVTTITDEVAIEVTFSNLSATGSATNTTTTLTLGFSDAIPGLLASDITLSGVSNVTKGALSATSTTGNNANKTYTLGISGFTSGGTLTVAVAKAGYDIKNPSRTVTIYYYDSSATDVTLNSVTADGAAGSSPTTKLTLIFSAAVPGLTANNITVTGQSNYTGFEKGDLSGEGPTYYLAINEITSGGTVSVTVAGVSGYNILGGPKTATIIYYEIDPGATQITLSSAIADGAAGGDNTTKITLTFSEAVPGLLASDITWTGLDGLTKGALTGDGPSYDLAVTPTKGGTVSLTVSKTNYAFLGVPATVAIYYGDAFDKAVAIKGENVTGSGIVTVDPETGIFSRENTASGEYGNYFSVKIPEALKPILASDTINVKYIGRSANKTAKIPITPKATNSSDLTPPVYEEWAGTATETVVSYKVTQYGSTIPTDELWFQSRPPQQPWELKFLEITVTKGAAIMVTTPVAGLKPVAGEAPKSAPDSVMQYTGTVAWKDASNNNVTGNFSAGGIYTATITLTASAGYTFAGIAANGLGVTGATTVTHEAGAGTSLVITATFPATEAAKPPLDVTFVYVPATGDPDDPDNEDDPYVPATFSVTGHNANVTPLTGDDEGKGYHVMTSAGYEWAYTYFKVTFPTGATLADYTKISFEVKGITNDSPPDGSTDLSGYKAGYMMAYATEAEFATINQLNDTDHLIFTETPGDAATGITDLGSWLPRTVTVRVPAGVTGNTIWVAYRVGGSTGYIWEIRNIKFFNP